jgi:hypothetical protein
MKGPKEDEEDNINMDTGAIVSFAGGWNSLRIILNDDN